MIDQPTKVRQGEDLNLTALEGYLANHLNGFETPLSVSQFPSGYSNLTYLLKAGQKAYVLRRPPFGANIKSAHDMGREYKVLSSLKPIYKHVPQPVLYCEDESVIGAPFYMMERVEGVILRNKAPEGMDASPAMFEALSKAAVDNLAQLHQIDLEKAGLASLGKPEGYVARQVEGWAKRYHNAATGSVPHMEKAAEWLLANQPDDATPAFIHNDYKYDNLVLDPNNLSNITAVLDWEMATVGHPLMDLGTTLGYWAEANDSPALKPFNLTWMPGNLNRAQVVTRYFEQIGQPEQDVLFFYVFGVFKIGVIVQQIYARYKKGLTKDPRFAQLGYVVEACGYNAHQAITHQRISNFK